MKAVDGANYLVYLMSDICDDLTNMKLNKLLYFAQGHYLQEYGVPLFDERMEAWDHGPVFPSVYAEYRKYGDAPVMKSDVSAAKEVPEDAANALFEAAREYGKYTASALRNMTHAVGGPWDRAYQGGKLHTEIPVSSIRDYFTRKEAKKLTPLELNLTDEDYIGYTDENGVLVLPAEWNDEAEAV